jgi:alpha-L-rhamnosidase
MKPHPVGDLTFVRATYNSIRGPIASAWENTESSFEWRITIPPNTTATVFIPTSSTDRVTESGRPAATSPSVTLLRAENGQAVYRIDSGTYHFRSVQPRATSN